MTEAGGNTADHWDGRLAGRPLCLRGDDGPAAAAANRPDLSDQAISRRAMLSRTARATAAVAVGAGLQPLPARGASPEEAKELVWDGHNHLATAPGSPEDGPQ